MEGEEGRNKERGKKKGKEEKEKKGGKGEERGKRGEKGRKQKEKKKGKRGGKERKGGGRLRNGKKGKSTAPFLLPLPEHPVPARGSSGRTESCAVPRGPDGASRSLLVWGGPKGRMANAGGGGGVRPCPPPRVLTSPCPRGGRLPEKLVAPRCHRLLLLLRARSSAERAGAGRPRGCASSPAVARGGKTGIGRRGGNWGGGAAEQPWCAVVNGPYGGWGIYGDAGWDVRGNAEAVSREWGGRSGGALSAESIFPQTALEQGVVRSLPAKSREGI